MSPTDFPSPELELATEELLESIESSRALVKQSRILIELSESDPAFPGDADDDGAAN